MGAGDSGPAPRSGVKSAVRELASPQESASEWRASNVWMSRRRNEGKEEVEEEEEEEEEEEDEEDAQEEAKCWNMAATLSMSGARFDDEFVVV